MNIEWLVMCALATYRMSQLLAVDEGPYGVFAEIRDYARVMYAKDSSKLWYNISTLIECPYCNGVWFGAMCALFVLSGVYALQAFVFVMAIAGGQSVIQDVKGGLDSFENYVVNRG